jgi:RNA-splicing ligase RtcB
LIGYAIMANDLKTGDSSAPATNGADERSASAVSIIHGPEKELSPAAANRFLVAEINRIMEENAELRQFKDKYYGAEKKLAVVKETLKSYRRHQVVSSACLIGGTAGLVAAPNFLGLSSYGWYAFITISAVLLIVGLASRVDGTSTNINTRY